MKTMHSVSVFVWIVCVLQFTAYSKFFLQFVYFLYFPICCFSFKILSIEKRWRKRRKICSLNKCFISILFSVFHFRPNISSFSYLIFFISVISLRNSSWNRKLRYLFHFLSFLFSHKRDSGDLPFHLNVCVCVYCIRPILRYAMSLPFEFTQQALCSA